MGLQRPKSRQRVSHRAKRGPVRVADVVGAHGSAAQDRWRNSNPTDRKEIAMRHRSILISVLALLALAVPAVASAAQRPRAVVFSQSTTVEGVSEGGLYAVRSGHLNQLTEDPSDSEPSFSADGRTIVFARDGDIWAMRADGSGQHALTGGPEVDSRPLVAPNGRYVLFERRAAAGLPRDLYTVRIGGGTAHELVSSPVDEREATFSPDGRTIAFVRGVRLAGGGTEDDLFSIRPSGARMRRLTRTTGVDEFAPRYFGGAGSLVFSRGRSGGGPSAYADIYTMRGNGSRVRALIRGAGSAYVEDVSPNGRLLLFRRDQGLWAKRIGRGGAGKLTELPDGSHTNGVFSADGRSVAAFVAVEDQQSLVAINVRTRLQTELAEGFEVSAEDGTVIGPVIAWQPEPHRG
jgi:dipeptidyl aminopeptidase/acylaminoacyl peptidase